VRASEFKPVVELESPLVQELVENSRQLCRLKRLLQEGTRTVFSRALAMFRLLAGGNEYNGGYRHACSTPNPNRIVASI
jgi:hypothetical protein